MRSADERMAYLSALISVFLIVLFAAWMAPARAETLVTSANYLNLNTCNDASCFSQTSVSGFETAAQFTLPGAANVDTISFSGIDSGYAFDVAIYADAGGKPGAQISRQTANLVSPPPANQCDVACRRAMSAGTFNRLVYIVSLPTPVALSSAPHWVSVIETSASSGWSWTASRGAAWFKDDVAPWAKVLRNTDAGFAYQIRGTLGGGTVNPDLQPYLQGNTTFGWAEGQLGRPTHPWNRRVDDMAKDPESDKYVRYMQRANQCFGGDQSICDEDLHPTLEGPADELIWRIDMGRDNRVPKEGYSVGLHIADNADPTSEYAVRAGDTFTPHCDFVRMPIVDTIHVQGNINEQCGPRNDPTAEEGDCHYYVVNMDDGQLYEQWRSYGPGNPPGFDDNGATAYHAGCTAKWDLTADLDADMRGWSCSSANGAGVAISPFLITPGEIKAGIVKHAVAVTWPNFFLAPNTYFRWDGLSAAGGGTHSPPRTEQSNYADPATTSGTVPMPGFDPALHKQPPYGGRFRLASSFVINPGWPAALKIILQAMKDYGLYHVDGQHGGTWILTSNDFFDAGNWDDGDVQLNPLDLHAVAQLTWDTSKLELVSDSANIGSMIASAPNGFNCSRTPIQEF